MFVIASDYAAAIRAWETLIRRENTYGESTPGLYNTDPESNSETDLTVEPPQGIRYVADDSDIIVALNEFGIKRGTTVKQNLITEVRSKDASS